MTNIQLPPTHCRAAAPARRSLAALAAFVLTALAACDSSSTEAARQATLVVKNQATEAIQLVQIASCTDEYWGANRLGPNQTVAPGGSRSFALEPGCWDLRLSTASRSDEWFDIELQAGGSIELALTATANLSNAQLQSAPEVAPTAGARR